jgi:hypothetical protein
VPSGDGCQYIAFYGLGTSHDMLNITQIDEELDSLLGREAELGVHK